VGSRSSLYLSDFKIEAVRLYRAAGRSQGEIASELGVATETLGGGSGGSMSTKGDARA
jgi:transposase-like protein